MDEETEDPETVHFSTGFHGISMYLTACNRPGTNHYFSGNKSLVDCEKCIATWLKK